LRGWSEKRATHTRSSRIQIRSNVPRANLALNAIGSTTPTNAFVATSDPSETASLVCGKYAYVSERWVTRFVSIDAPAACRLPAGQGGRGRSRVRRLPQRRDADRALSALLYFENDLREKSVDLLDFMRLRYDLYWHLAPIFDPVNFFDNPDNHWAPRNICSLMMLGVPSERKITVANLPKGLTRMNGGTKKSAPGQRG
jgi:hypothetical protein